LVVVGDGGSGLSLLLACWLLLVAAAVAAAALLGLKDYAGCCDRARRALQEHLPRSRARCAVGGIR